MKGLALRRNENKRFIQSFQTIRELADKNLTQQIYYRWKRVSGHRRGFYLSSKSFIATCHKLFSQKAATIQQEALALLETVSKRQEVLEVIQKEQILKRNAKTLKTYFHLLSKASKKLVSLRKAFSTIDSVLVLKNIKGFSFKKIDLASQRAHSLQSASLSLSQSFSLLLKSRFLAQIKLFSTQQLLLANKGISVKKELDNKKRGKIVEAWKKVVVRKALVVEKGLELLEQKNLATVAGFFANWKDRVVSSPDSLYSKYKLLKKSIETVRGLKALEIMLQNKDKRKERRQVVSICLTSIDELMTFKVYQFFFNQLQKTVITMDNFEYAFEVTEKVLKGLTFRSLQQETTQDKVFEAMVEQFRQRRLVKSFAKG